jgi:hypothetical protein
VRERATPAPAPWPTTHSEKACASPTFKHGGGFYPLWSLVHRGGQGQRRALAFLLRAGNADSNTVADHKTSSAPRWPSRPDRHHREVGHSWQTSKTRVLS